jgi:hypothetical protein
VFPLCISLAVAAQPAGPTDADCRVLTKGDSYVVHTVRVGPRTPGGPVANPRGPLGIPFGPRYAILHTDTKTGKLKKLVEGGAWLVPFPEMAVNRATEHSVSIAAVATGPDRLYVLVMRSSALVEHVGPGSGVRREPRVEHVLYVFRLADGSMVQELTLPEPRERLAGFMQDTLDPDLIRVTPTTVRVGATEYRIGERLVPVESKP